MTVSDFFRELTSADEQSQPWRDWFTARGIDPDVVAWDGWVERRENRILYLVHATRDGEPIHQQRVLHFDTAPPAFP